MIVLYINIWEQEPQSSVAGKTLWMRGQGIVNVDDGTAIGYQLFGPGDGAVVVLANGIGVDFRGMELQVEALCGSYRVVAWDYRGVGRSRTAAARSNVSMERHARDILAVLDHLAVQRCVFVGWSMGVQVALEVARHQPRRLAGLVALLGAAGRPLQGAFPAPMARVVGRLLRTLASYPAVTQGSLELAVALPQVAFRVLSALRLVGPRADRRVFQRAVQSVMEADTGAYFQTMSELLRHDARDVLSSLSAPLLVICGGRDRLTPPAVARELSELAPRSVLREVPEGTHFALLEYPSLVNGWLLEFVEQVSGSL